MNIATTRVVAMFIQCTSFRSSRSEAYLLRFAPTQSERSDSRSDFGRCDVLRRSDRSRCGNECSPRRERVVATFTFAATLLRRSEYRCDAMENIASQRWETVAAMGNHRCDCSSQRWESDGFPSLRCFSNLKYFNNIYNI